MRLHQAPGGNIHIPTNNINNILDKAVMIFFVNSMSPTIIICCTGNAMPLGIQYNTITFLLFVFIFWTLNGPQGYLQFTHFFPQLPPTTCKISCLVDETAPMTSYQQLYVHYDDHGLQWHSKLATLSSDNEQGKANIQVP